MRADSPFEGTAPTTTSPIFIHLYLYSWVLRLADVSSATSATLLLVLLSVLAREMSLPLHKPPVERSPIILPGRGWVRRHHMLDRVSARIYTTAAENVSTQTAWWGGCSASAAWFRGIGGEQLPRKQRRQIMNRETRERSHAYFWLECGTERLTIERIWTTKRRFLPLPDRILGASSVSAGRWSQTSVCYFHTESFVLFFWIGVCQLGFAQDCFSYSRTTPTLQKSQVANPPPELAEILSLSASFPVMASF